jgi:hypothetical protein
MRALPIIAHLIISIGFPIWLHKATLPYPLIDAIAVEVDVFARNAQSVLEGTFVLNEANQASVVGLLVHMGIVGDFIWGWRIWGARGVRRRLRICRSRRGQGRILSEHGHCEEAHKEY